jgi:hypothetical protein
LRGINASRPLATSPMKILLLAYHFAPFNHIGAVRMTKTAKYLLALGHELRIVTTANTPLRAGLETEVDESLVTRVPCHHLNRSATGLSPGTSSGLISAASASTRGRGGLRGIPARWAKTTSMIAKTLLWYPDDVRLWRRRLVREACAVVKAFQPEIIFASGPPFTPLIAAAEVSKRCAIPWVCELRDLWVSNHNYRYPAWRRAFEKRLERRTLSSAAALVTVSQPLADKLAAQYRQTVMVIPNGFDASDFPDRGSMAFPKQLLNIVYTGTLYEGKQDSHPLFEAMRLVNESPCPVRLHLFGRRLDPVLRAARHFGLESQVQFHGEISHTSALNAQRSADLLLLLLWNDVAEKGVFTGKIFEYLGARRPILAVGPSENVAAELILSRRAGLVSSSPGEIAAFLSDQSTRKQRLGMSPDLPPSVAEGLSRREQVQHLSTLLARIRESSPERPDRQ